MISCKNRYSSGELTSLRVFVGKSTLSPSFFFCLFRVSQYTIVNDNDLLIFFSLVQHFQVSINK